LTLSSVLIDLHTHTTASDGTTAPSDLIEQALNAGLEAIAITDHDTFAGYDEASPIAAGAALDLVCGIELSTKYNKRSIHLLGYFPVQPPTAEFRDWLRFNQESRRDRNRRLAQRLQSLGLDVKLEEVERLGRSLAGRPHFAQLLVQKGYVSSYQEAFDEYLDEAAKGYVDRDEAQLGDAIERVAAAGGIPTLAHPIRVTRDAATLRALLVEMKPRGLAGIEVFHSDHSAADSAEYQMFAREFDLLPTGGSDFHGDRKPSVRLGTGVNRNLNISRMVLDRLRLGAIAQ
ncbi:MAG: PHP domain-containing protein, partial [Candidatus Acidiferrales bacterium]